jgi:hypothetical protein
MIRTNVTGHLVDMGIDSVRSVRSLRLQWNVAVFHSVVSIFLVPEHSQVWFVSSDWQQSDLEEGSRFIMKVIWLLLLAWLQSATAASDTIWVSQVTSGGQF